MFKISSKTIIITKENIKKISKLFLYIKYNIDNDIEYLSIYKLNKEKFESITNYFIGDKFESTIK